jgi:ribonuclease-3
MLHSDFLDSESVGRLEERLGYRFLVRETLVQALTHTSYANEHPGVRHQEGLALLGDAALGLVVAERLLAEDPGASVGVLTSRRAEVVSGANLARWASDLELGALLRLGRGEDLTGGRRRESILATTLEALLGLMYLEDGLDAVRGVVARLGGGPRRGC